MILADYHNHTTLCKHALGTVDEYLDRALSMGVTEYGFSCHGPMPAGFDPRHRMIREELPTYVSWIESARRRYEGRLTIKLGLEVDYAPEHLGYVREMVASQPFDYIIGSVHFLANWGFDNPEERERWNRVDVATVYRDYFRSIADLARTGLYDIVGHIDLVKKFGIFPDQDFSPFAAEALDAIAMAGMCIEINTSGLRRPVAEIYPSDRILKMACERNIPITFGADAHDVDDVSADLDRAVAAALRAGYTHQQIFDKRKRRSVPLAGDSALGAYRALRRVEADRPVS